MTGQLLYRALSIGDLGKSLPFYRDGLGFQPVGGPQIEEGAWLEAATGLPGARRVRQPVRNDQGITLDLYAFSRPAPVGPRERRKNNRYGLTHLAFYVDEIDAWAARVAQSGGHVFPHTRATFRDNGTTMMYCTDPDGIRVELMQAPGERERFSHSGVCMEDVEVSLAFYRELFGFVRAENYELYDHGYFMDVINELDDVKLRAQMIRDPQGNTIELLKMQSPPAFGPREPLPVNQYGFCYLGFAVDDIEAAAAKVRGLGGRMLNDRPAEHETMRILFCADPIGARIALIQAG